MSSTFSIPDASHSAVGPAADRGVPGTVSERRRVVSTSQAAALSEGVSGQNAEPVDLQPTQSQSFQSASRLISETAHDLRAPLGTVRESVRLVRDEELGPLTVEQKECLSAAIDECNCAAQLVDEMVLTRQFDSGFPNVRRRWISIDQVRQSVDSTLQPWMMPRRIRLLWDGPFSTGTQVYADPTLLRRLIVNLASNAIRATRAGQAVLIRAALLSGGENVQWSVVDQGNGISSSDLALIASGNAPSQSVGGLGLMISRQLAAAHFSTLAVESRVGTGTVVSFTTPRGGPAAVVDCWIRWRSRLIAMNDPQVRRQRESVRRLRPAKAVPRQSKEPGRISADDSSRRIVPPRRFRIDRPSESIEVTGGQWKPVFSDRVYMNSVSLGAAVPVSSADSFDAFLQRSIRVTELAYRTGRREWVLVWDADRETGLNKQIELERNAQYELDGIRMSWGSASEVATTSNPRSSRPIAVRLCDRLVRGSLTAHQKPADMLDQVRLGTAPLRPSAVATARLEMEIKRLKASR